MKNIHQLFHTTDFIQKQEGSFLIKNTVNDLIPEKHKPERYVVHLLGLGDVGKNLAIGLRLLGSDCISHIGLWDLDEIKAQYMARELSQVVMPEGSLELPNVYPVCEKNLCDCHVLIFAASMSVPAVDSSNNDKDVRMAQLKSNAKLVRSYVDKCKKTKYSGKFFIVSDPVDPLCKIALEGFQGTLDRNQVAGFGLGVMYARAGYHALDKEDFWKNGRVYGPHGKGLVAINSHINYNAKESRRITREAIIENIKIREMGYKPNIAPAFSSGAISIVEMLKGHWHYSSAYFGDNGNGAFLGIRNRLVSQGRLIEDIPLPDEVFSMIEASYNDLKNLDL